MKYLSTREIREELPHIERLLIKEKEVVLTRHGQPVARILPTTPTLSPRLSHAKLRAMMPRMKVDSAVYLRQDRDNS